MYFNHAFRKSFLSTYYVNPALGPAGVPPGAVLSHIGVTTPNGSTADLSAGQIGLFDAQTYQSFTNANSGKPFILAQGSYFKLTSDKIGPVHGGYQESVKSKVINPKYITRVFTTCSTPPVNEIKEICVCKVECGKTYRLRLDLKGSPALRFLSHNIYRTLDAFTGCCTDDCSATCTGALVDPTIVTIKWAKQVVENPIVSQFFQVEVLDWDGNTVADSSSGTTAEFLADLDAYVPNTTEDFSDTDLKSCIRLTVAYIDTKFGNCTFTPTDFYEVQPLRVFASMTDETGEPCNVQCVTISGQVDANGNLTPAYQEPLQAQGLGETVLRDMILTGRYRQEAFPDSSRVESLRMREIEANPGLATIDRNGFYNSINILHSVPRFNNPTGTFDNDQYLLTIYIEDGINASSLLDQLDDIINYCCPGLEIEHYCAGPNGGGAAVPATPEVVDIDYANPCIGSCLGSAAVPAAPAPTAPAQG